MEQTYDDADDRFHEFAVLWTAETAEDLHRVLALQQPIRSSADWFEPYSLLSRHHKNEPHTSTVTAILLLTDRRWRKGVGRLVNRIADSDIIDADGLAQIATTFITADDYVYWQVPDSWLSDESIVISIEHRADAANNADEMVDEESVGEERVVVARRVHPPLRRWAVAHMVVLDPRMWRALLTDARDRSGTNGTAVMAGLFDGFDRLPDAACIAIIRQGIDWPRANIRKRALERFADLGHRQLAHDMALCDPSARIRTWAPTLIATEPTPPDETAESDIEPVADQAQETLF